MSTALADPVMSAIRGAQAAREAIAEVERGCAPPDALHEALQTAISTGDMEMLRAFARQCQKALEQRR
jgi:hypothetical protein